MRALLLTAWSRSDNLLVWEIGQVPRPEFLDGGLKVRWS